MQLVIISGRSGSGKTVALNALEDSGYYCIDNIPLNLLPELKKEISSIHDKIAVSIDSRNIPENFNIFKNIIKKINNDSLKNNVIIYLDASENTILKRYSETRRKHPLTNENTSLREAIIKETSMLAPIADLAHCTIDTDQLTANALHHIVKERFSHQHENILQILVQSFGFKFGVPPEADFVFDVRCLPNPFWEVHLKNLNGKDQPVIDFLENEPTVLDMKENIYSFLEKSIPKFKIDNRSYINIAIGCTGGQHRSVYIAENIYKNLKKINDHILIKHREIKN